MLGLVVPLNHDVAWGLYASRRILEGARPYVDFIETNPPLFLYLGVPFEWWARVTGWPEARVVGLAVSLLTAVTVGLWATLLRHRWSQSGPSVSVMLFAVIVVGLVLPEQHVGQREHLAVLLILPYCLLCATRAIGSDRVSSGATIAAGVLAAVGFALKPHFVAVWAALLAFVVAARRDWRLLAAPENVVVGAGVGAYVVSLFVLTPEYVWNVVPRVYRLYERGYGVSNIMQVVLRNYDLPLLAASSLALLLGAQLVSRDPPALALVRLLALASLVFFAIYLQQAKGYYYHLFPAVAMNMLAAVVAALGWYRTVGAERTAVPAARRLLRLAGTTAFIGALGLPSAMMLWAVGQQHVKFAGQRRAGVSFGAINASLVELVRARAAGRPIFVMSSSVAPAFPLVNLSGATWPYRYNCFWPLPAHYRDDRMFRIADYHSPATQSAEERAFFDDVVGQLERTPPVLLFVEQLPFKQGFGLVQFDYLQYFRQSPAFNRLFAQYVPIETDAPWAVYEWRPHAQSGQTPHATAGRSPVPDPVPDRLRRPPPHGGR